MKSNDTTTKLIQLASEHFNREVSRGDLDKDFFAMLGINSYDAMELLTRVEESFDIEIPDYELQGVTTFRNLAEVIESRL